MITTTTYETQRHGTANHIDCVITYAEQDRAGTVLLINRDQVNARTIEVDLRTFAASTLTETIVLADDDHHAANTLADPNRVSPRALKAATVEDGRLTAVLPPVSWAAIAFR